MDDFYRFNSADEDKKLAALAFGGRLALAVGNVPTQVRFEQVDSSTAFVGYAAAGTGVSTPAWQVAKITTDAQGGVVKMYADSDASFSKQWDLRLTYTY